MAISWSAISQNTIKDVLERHDIHSHECDLAARAIIVVAREHDPKSRTLAVRPRGRARFVVPKVDLGGRSWFVHYSVEVTEHCVDALTGADGTETKHYLEEHWHYPEHLHLVPEDPPDVA